jgi:ABC-2 type transport system permease protein
MSNRVRKIFPFAGLWPIFRKEIIQITRDPATLFFALFLPIVELLMLGYAVDTNVRQIKTVVYDMALTQQSRELINHFVNTDDFKIIKAVYSDKELNDAIVAGEAKVGIKIPEDYSRRLMEGETANVLVLVDGSDSTVTGEAIGAANGVALQESLKLILISTPSSKIPLETRNKVLFNPDTRSPNFFIPGLIAILLQAMLIVLVAFSIVREREKGTLDQLYMTPIGSLGLMLGKVLPYGILGFFEVCWILLIMRYVFDVPIHGSLGLLLLFSIPFIMTILGMGLMISTKASTQTEAMQMAMSTLLPSIFLSGYIFSIDNMPTVFVWISRFIPATYYIDTLRAIILRGAGLNHLWLNGIILFGMSAIMILIAAKRFSSKAA